MPHGGVGGVLASAKARLRLRSPGFVAVVEAQHSSSGIRPLEAVRQLGHRAVFVSNDPQRYADLPNADLLHADGVDVLTADTNSVTGLLAAVEPLGRGGRLRGIYTNCDYNLPLVCAVAHKLGLPGLDPQAAATARHKLLSRRACAAAGVAGPRFVHALTLAQALAAPAEVGLPCVVKPMTDSASNGVRLCATADEVAAAFTALAAQPLDARGQRRTPGALIEEYALGYEVSVETVTWNGRTTVLGTTDKLLGPHPYFAELGDTFPSVLPEPATRALAAAATAALAATGHDFGAAHTEVKMTADGPKIIEINSRIAGAEIAAEIDAALGIEYLREVLRMHLGEAPDLTPTRTAGAATRYLAAPAAGTIAAVRGVDQARRMPGVRDVQVRAVPGSRVDLPASNHDLYGHVLATAGTAAEANRWVEAAANQISLLLDGAAA